MNAQAITAKIIEDARASAAQTLRDANDRAARIRVDADETTAKKRAEAQRQAKLQTEEMRDRMLRMAELEQKKGMLAVKRALIDEAFSDALYRMRAMPAAQKKRFIQKLLVESSQNGEELIPSAEEAPLYDAAFVAELGAALAAAGKAQVTLSGETRKLGGGFVLKQGGMEINCAYDAVLGQARPALEADVAKALFDDAGAR